MPCVAGGNEGERVIRCFERTGNQKILLGKEDVWMPIRVIEEKCTACGSCEEVCPSDAITVEDVAVIDEEECVECETCIDECPSEAIVSE